MRPLNPERFRSVSPTMRTLTTPSGHEVVVKENRVGQWNLSVWAGPALVDSTYGNLPAPSDAQAIAIGQRLVEHLRALETAIWSAA